MQHLLRRVPFLTLVISDSVSVSVIAFPRALETESLERGIHFIGKNA